MSGQDDDSDVKQKPQSQTPSRSQPQSQTSETRSNASSESQQGVAIDKPVLGEVMVEPAVQQDASELARLFVESAAVAASAFQGLPIDVVKRQSEKMPDVVKKLFDAFVATKVFKVHDASNQKILGFGMINLKRAWIEGLYVDPSVHGQGCGQLLLATMEQLARHEGLHFLYLASSLYAEGFFLKFKYRYENDKRKERPLQSAGMRMRAVNMKKIFG